MARRLRRPPARHRPAGAHGRCEGAVDELLRPRGAPFEGRPARVEGAPLDPVNAYGHDVLWWLDRAVRARHPLVERMTFNWHDHFATSNSGVGDTRLMLKQYDTLRRGAPWGASADLARAITRDRAMQLWLSLANSEKGSPNENYARELLELFTLGVNNGYTERDVREAARALTGFTFDYESGRFGFDPDRHDAGTKRILGRIGRFSRSTWSTCRRPQGARALPLRQALGLLLAAARARPSWSRGSPASTQRGHRRAAGAARDPHQQAPLRPLDEPGHGQAAVRLRGRACCALTGRRVDDESWVYRLDQMGQVPFHPPNVSGWEGGTAWLSTSSIRARFDAATCVLTRRSRTARSRPSRLPPRPSPARSRPPGRPRVGPRTKKALQRYAVKSVAGRTEKWEVEHYYPERQRVLRHLLLAGPDAQVC